MLLPWILFSPSPTPYPSPSLGLSLISCSPLASVFFKQLVFCWTPTSNIHLKEPKPSHVRKKAPESYLPSTATLSLSISLPHSTHPSIRPSQSKMLFVYHHWSILAPGCCIRISSLTGTDVYVRMRAQWYCWFISDFTGSWFILIPGASCWL